MKVYAVGGAIRDTLMGLPVHDIDYVVVGATVEGMIAQGYRPVGKDFPVFLHPETQAEYALARTERKTGTGYKGFTFYADPSVTLDQDLQRRDLTINAMAQEVGEDGNLMGPISDPCNGQADLAAKVFRHVSDAFAEDPLRLLRIARFAARFPEFTIAAETMRALQAIVSSNELAALSAERIWQELARGLTAEKPMRMFQVLLDTGAASFLLPASLTAQLAQEEAREAWTTYLNVIDSNLEDRCAVILMDLSSQDICTWAECVRMPNEVRDYSAIFSELMQLVAKTKDSINHVYEAVDVLSWFNRADAWRKPLRASALLKLAKKMDFNVIELIKALEQTQLLNTAEVIATISTKDRANGECIRSAIELARLMVITAVLKN
jgi:tRNA nucleotidyltransferase (CCA-adding enzyme)